MGYDFFPSCFALVRFTTSALHEIVMSHLLLKSFGSTTSESTALNTRQNERWDQNSKHGAKALLRSITQAAVCLHKSCRRQFYNNHLKGLSPIAAQSKQYNTIAGTCWTVKRPVIYTSVPLVNIFVALCLMNTEERVQRWMKAVRKTRLNISFNILISSEKQ